MKGRPDPLSIPRSRDISPYLANLVISAKSGSGGDKIYTVFFGQTIFTSPAPVLEASPSRSDRRLGNAVVQEEFSVAEDDLELSESAFTPFVIDSLQDLNQRLVPLTQSEVVEAYDAGFRARGSDVVIERLLNFVYILRADLTGDLHVVGQRKARPRPPRVKRLLRPRRK